MEIIKKVVFGITLIVATTLISPLAYAVTTDNVKCSQCVDASDIKKSAVTTSRIKNGAITVDKLSAEVIDAINQQGGSSQPQFVGFSTDVFDGGQGVITYTKACQQDYPGSRMCTTEDFLNTTD